MSNSDNLRPEPPKWNNLPTKVIRVPEKFADKIMEYARYLDTEPEERTNLFVALSDDIVELLKSLSEEQKISIEEVLRKAIAGEHYFWNEQKAGSKILLQNADKEIREVLFR